MSCPSGSHLRFPHFRPPTSPCHHLPPPLSSPGGGRPHPDASPCVPHATCRRPQKLPTRSGGRPIVEAHPSGERCSNAAASHCPHTDPGSYGRPRPRGGRARSQQHELRSRQGLAPGKWAPSNAVVRPPLPNARCESAFDPSGHCATRVRRRVATTHQQLALHDNPTIPTYCEAAPSKLERLNLSHQPNVYFDHSPLQPLITAAVGAPGGSGPEAPSNDGRPLPQRSA